MRVFLFYLTFGIGVVATLLNNSLSLGYGGLLFWYVFLVVALIAVYFRCANCKLPFAVYFLKTKAGFVPLSFRFPGKRCQKCGCPLF